MDVLEKPLQCLVCTIEIKSTRFGMDVCRACSAFFKRTKVAGKQFACRQGDMKCPTANNEKTICRGCRFAKCIAIGMEYDGPLKVRRKTKSNMLKRIKVELKALKERRREREMKIIKQHRGHSKFPHPKEELYYTHRDTSMEIYEIFISESYEFFKNVFPEFSKLEDREQELIFKDYIGKMGMVEGYQRTVQLWGGPTKYQTYSVMTCYENTNVHSHGVDENMENKNIIISCIQTNAEELNKITFPILTRCALKEREYYALMALVMFEIDIECELSKEADEILDNYRREVLEELQLYYKRELCIIDYSTRLGNLMSANHAIQEGKSLFKLFYRFYST
ncbi:hypothetical protein PRIPAC_77948, partial [Pristionchus pacificus]